MRITAADFVKIDSNDVRQVVDTLDDDAVAELDDLLTRGYVVLGERLVGWGGMTHTARYGDTTYHVCVEG